MRFAYIDHRLNDKTTFSNEIIDYAKNNNIVLDVAETFEEFNNKHISPSNYDGLIIHPGKKNFDSMVNFRKQNTTPMVIVAAGVQEYEDDVDNIKVIDYLQKDKLFNLNNYRSA